MNTEKKKRIISIAGFVGVGVVFVSSRITEGMIPGGIVGIVGGYLIFAGLAALLLHFVKSK